MRKFNKLIDRVGLIIVKILLVYQLKLIVVAEKLSGKRFLNIYLEYSWVLSFRFCYLFLFGNGLICFHAFSFG